MISQITLKNFKSIKSAKLKLGPFNLFIGTNASGKSNFLDALRFLQGIGWGLSIDEILNGRPRTGTGSEWEGIRGGSGMVEYQEAGADEGPAKQVGMDVDMNLLRRFSPTSYSIRFNAKRGSVREEWYGTEYDTTDIENRLESAVIRARYDGATGQGRKPHLEFEKHKPILQQMVTHPDVEKSSRKSAQLALDVLSSIRRIDPQPSILRQYSTAREVDRMGERGENFAALVQSILKNKGAEPYLQWLRELRPEEIDELVILEGALKEPMFALKERGRIFPAPVLSDGTLRFAAITAAFFQPDMPKLMTIEEIENGVNPARMRVLMELVRHRAGQNDTQVIATTHSPLLLDWLTEEEWQYTFLCHREEGTGETKILPLTEIPRFKEVAKVGKVGELFSEGWLDFAL
jgi:predicted ATPase